jgi:D-alanyl-D-alanine carboxypeptidase
MAIERREWGNFYGYLVNVKENGKVVAEGAAAWPELQARVKRVNDLAAQLSQLGKERHWRHQLRAGADPFARSQAGAGRQADTASTGRHGSRACRAECTLQSD